MGNIAYISIDKKINKRVLQPYIGVKNRAKKVIKAYIGDDNNLAREWWSKLPNPIEIELDFTQVPSYLYPEGEELLIRMEVERGYTIKHGDIIVTVNNKLVKGIIKSDKDYLYIPFDSTYFGKKVAVNLYVTKTSRSLSCQNRYLSSLNSFGTAKVSNIQLWSRMNFTVPKSIPESLTDMTAMFNLCENFNQDISGWDTSKVTDMSRMFNKCENFNQDISKWDTSKVTNMNNMFSSCTSFNQNLGGWDTSKVTDMSRMFPSCTSFNQNLGGWDTSKVTNMNNMFSSCTSFNQDISKWDTSNVTDMTDMFNSCSTFNQDISGWDVTNVDSAHDGFAEGATAWNSAYLPKWDK